MEDEAIIIGAGPAGLSAAITLAYHDVGVRVIDAATAGGALMNTYPWKKVDSYLGFSDKTGKELAGIITDHALSEGVLITENETVIDVKKNGEKLDVVTSKGTPSCKALIVACGLGSPRKPGIDGECLDGVIHCVKDPNAYRGKKVFVVGGGDSAAECAAKLKRCGAESVIVHRRDCLRATEKNVACVRDECVEVFFESRVKKIIGDKNVESIILDVGGREKEFDADNVLFCLGTEPNSGLIERMGLKTRGASIDVDSNMRTSMEAVFAAGDAVGKWIRIPQAVGEGGLAGLNAFKYLKNPYWA